MVEWLLWLECWNGRVWALKEGQTGETRRGCCPLCQWPAGVHGASPWGWVRIKGKARTGDIIVRVCYRPPDQEDWADEVLYRQIGAASCSQALVLTGDFSHPDICWWDNTELHKQSRRFLECIHDNFLLQVTNEPTRAGAVLDLVLTNKGGAGRECAAQGQPWLQWPWNSGVQDP